MTRTSYETDQFPLSLTIPAFYPHCTVSKSLGEKWNVDWEKIGIDLMDGTKDNDEPSSELELIYRIREMIRRKMGQTGRSAAHVIEMRCNDNER